MLKNAFGPEGGGSITFPSRFAKSRTSSTERPTVDEPPCEIAG